MALWALRAVFLTGYQALGAKGLGGCRESWWRFRGFGFRLRGV